jgi:hypothetical protein
MVNQMRETQIKSGIGPRLRKGDVTLHRPCEGEGDRKAVARQRTRWPYTIDDQCFNIS